jgi:hypothetical protein
MTSARRTGSARTTGGTSWKPPRRRPGVDVEFVVVPRRSLTIVVDRAAPPTFEQVRASIEVVERYRKH